jgi:hypothetical protein
MSRTLSNAVIVDAVTQRLAALKGNVPAKSQIEIDGKAYKPSDLIAIFQASLDTRAALIKSRAQAKVDLAARGAAEGNRNAIEPGLKSWVTGKFGATSNEALEFGYAPRKTATKSAETKATAARLAEATREARGTMGKKERLKVKGTLPVSAAPAAPAITAPVTPAHPTLSRSA